MGSAAFAALGFVTLRWTAIAPLRHQRRKRGSRLSMKAFMPSRHSGPSISVASASRSNVPGRGQISITAHAHGPLRLSDRARAEQPEPAGQFHRRRHQVTSGMNAGYEAMGDRFRGRDVAAEQNPFERLAATHKAMKLLNASGAGECSDPHFGHSDPCVIGHQSEIAGDRHFAAAAQCKAVDRGDRRYRQSLDTIEDGGDPLKVVIAQREAARTDARIGLRKVMQMRTCAKSSARPGDNERARPPAILAVNAWSSSPRSSRLSVFISRSRIMVTSATSGCGQVSVMALPDPVFTSSAADMGWSFQVIEAFGFFRPA